MAPENRAPFATYLLPSLSFPLCQRRQSSTSTTSETHENAIPCLTHSRSSSLSSDSSPPSPSLFSPDLKSLLYAALLQSPPARSKPAIIAITQPNTLRCITCGSDIAFAAQIVSKGFTGRHGRAYLVEPPSTKLGRRTGELANLKVGRTVTRELLTGTHVVADVTCTICSSVLGWKYVDAKEPAQKYKVGKFILETKRVVMQSHWEDGVLDSAEDEEDITVVDYDSEDEEDLFSY